MGASQVGTGGRVCAGAIGVVLAVGSLDTARAGVMPVTYEMINGNTGTWSYLDETYTSANAGTSNALLTGGLGDLTDGLGKTTNEWFGPSSVVWVGWYEPFVGSTVSITFDFGGQVELTDVTIWSLNGTAAAGPGGNAGILHFASADWEYSGNGQTWSAWGTAQPDAAQNAFGGVSGVELGAGTVNAQYARVTMTVRPSASWIFTSEVEFSGDASPVIPLPHAGGMGLAGLGLLSMRRRRTTGV